MEIRLPQVIKKGLLGLIRDFDYIEGFAVGGSIAAGTYNKGDDTDTDILYASYTGIPSNVWSDLRNRFSELTEGQILHIRAPLAREVIDGLTLEDQFRAATIYLFRSEAERVVWQISEMHEIYYLD